MTVLQQNMLLGLYERRYLPVACFAMTRAGEASVYAIALAPVYLTSPADSLDDIKALGKSLSQLEEAGLITLDYDLPLQGYDYDEYKRASVYDLFVRTVAEGSAQPDSLFDTPLLELGSMALTERGIKAVEAMMD